MSERPSTSGPACRECGREVQWREGWGWLHTLNGRVVWPHADTADHEPDGYWPEDEKPTSTPGGDHV